MNKVKCANEKEPHFFDADKYSLCPHCGAPKRHEGGEDIVATSETGDGKSVKKPRQKGIFPPWGKGKKTTEKPMDIPQTESPETGKGNTGKIPTSGNMPYEDFGDCGASEEEVNPPAETGGTSFPETEVLLKPVAADWNREEKDANPSFRQPFRATHKDDGIVTDSYPLPPSSVSNGNTHTGGGKTLDDIKTQTIYVNEQGDEPVTGWLVCVQGEYWGSSFELKAGVNVISRDSSADVCLKKDVRVSRSMHASVIYEPKKKIFFLGNGERSLTYCNGELLEGRRELSSYDSIEIGMGTYLFIPFCGERFDWDKE